MKTIKTIKTIMLLFSIIGFMSYVIAVDYETCEKDCINDGGIPRECHRVCCVTSCTADGGSSSGCYSACTPRGSSRGRAVDYETCEKDCINDGGIPRECHRVCCVTSCTADGGSSSGCYSACTPRAPRGSCRLNNVFYPAGTIYGDYVCRQGEWITGACLSDETIYPDGTTRSISGNNYVCQQGEWIIQ